MKTLALVPILSFAIIVQAQQPPNHRARMAIPNVKGVLEFDVGPTPFEIRVRPDGKEVQLQAFGRPDKLGISAGIMTTIHSYTNDQVLTDVYHSDLRRARSATMSMIPTKTGAAAAVGLVLPELKGKLDGFAVRVPTINVSLVDLTFTAKRATTVEEVNKTLQQAAAAGPLHRILGYTDGPLVSVDFNHDSHSSVFDATLTKVVEGTLVKVCSWYDNEWGFSNRMLDTTLAWSKAP